MLDIFTQMGIMFLVATVGGFFSKLIRQPLIPAYILTGIILGPILGIITNSEVINSLSMIGIAFLLFIVGLELNLSKIREVGKFAIIGGLLQVILTYLFGHLAASVLGFTFRESVYTGLIVAFSSTMVVIKLLSDKHEIDTLHGRLIIGILLMQDIIAVVAFSLLTTLDQASSYTLVFSLLKAASIVIVALFCSRFLFPFLFAFAAKSQELLFLASLSTCFLFSIAFSLIGFPIAVGAFIAGISIAHLPYHYEIIARVRSLKDFFATMFFVSLGMAILVNDMKALMLPLLLLTFVAVVLKPFVVMLLTALFGYAKRTSFLTAISLGQISEFSLIIASIGVSLGHVNAQFYTLIVLLAMVSITLTSYFVKFDLKLAMLLSRPLSIFDLMSRGKHLEYTPSHEHTYDVILVGYDRIGYTIFKALEKMRKSFFVVDYNPDIISQLVKKHIPCMYGDIADTEVRDRLNFEKAELVICTVPDMVDNLLILQHVRGQNKRALVFVTATIVDEAIEMYQAGADYVILPHFLGGEYVSDLLQNLKDVRTIIQKKYDHIEELKRRKSIGHEHPLHYG